MKILSQAGDTIVEVLIALVLIGGVVAAAYSITNSTLNVENDAQTRNQALQIAQNQLETIKSLYSANSSAITGITGIAYNSKLCVLNGSIQIVTLPLASPHCYFDYSGLNGSTTSSSSTVYTVFIKNTSSTRNPWSQIEVVVNWTPTLSTTHKLSLNYGFNDND